MNLNIWWNLLVLFYICWNLKILETHDCDKDTSLETWWVIHGAMCLTLGILFCSLGIPPTPIAAPLACLTLILQPKYPPPQKMLHHQFQRGKNKASVFFLPLHEAMTVVSVSSLCHGTKLGSQNELPQLIIAQVWMLITTANTSIVCFVPGNVLSAFLLFPSKPNNTIKK